MMRFFTIATVLLLAPYAFGQTGAAFKPYKGLDTSNVWKVLNPPGSQVLSLDDALHTAMTKNYTVVENQLSVVSAQDEKSRTKADLYPDLNASAGYTWSHYFNPPSSFGITSPNTGNTVNYNLRTTFNIYAGGFDAASINTAEYALDAAQHTLTWTRQQTAFAVTADYVTVLRDRELVISAQKTLAEAHATLDLDNGQYQAGVATIATVYQQESVVGQDELALIQAENTYENDKAALLFQLNIPPNQYNSYSVSLSGIDTTTTLERRMQIDTAMIPTEIDSVLATRPDIIAARSTIESSQADVDVINSALLPSLNSFAQIGGSGNNAPTIGGIQPENAFSAGLTLSVPLFDKLQNRLRVDEEKVVVEENQVHLTQIEQQLRSDVAVAVNNVKFAEESLDASEMSVLAAEETMRLANEKLRIGAGTQVDVVVAEAQVATARTNRINAVFNYVLALKQFDYTLGRWDY